MINQKCQFRLGKKVHGLVTMDRFKTTCPKWLGGFFLCSSKMGFFLPKFIVKKKGILVVHRINQTIKNTMVHSTNMWKHNKLSIAKLGIVWNFVVHNFWSGLGSLWRGQLIHYSHFLGNFCVVLFISSFTRLGTRSETCNIFVLRCLGHVKPNRVVNMTPKPIWS
jgi:hypothetical protein